MACYHPLTVWRLKGAFDPITGKWPITFNPEEGVVPLQIPCGKCIGCRLEYSRQWAIRAVHEALMHEENMFITLTYDNDHCPSSLRLDHFQRFMKRLRKHFAPRKIRFFHCGEYGEHFGRPHYHAIIFGACFHDLVYFRTDHGNRTYISPTLQKLWPYGFSLIGDVTFESCAYVARYITKKITGPDADEHYLDPTTGELRKPEYVTMSRRPGIGRSFLEKYKGDVYNYDRVLIRGHLSRPPKFYDRCLEDLDPDEYSKVTLSRLDRKHKMLLAHEADNSAERLAVREKCKLNSVNFLKRKFENGM